MLLMGRKSFKGQQEQQAHLGHLEPLVKLEAHLVHLDLLVQQGRKAQREEQQEPLDLQGL
jgi:hypothetical protein